MILARSYGDGDQTLRIVRAAMGEDRASAAGQGWRSRTDGIGQQAVRERPTVAAALGRALVRFAGALWPLEDGASAL